MDVSVIVFTGDLISRAPYLVAWTLAVILAVIMVRRGGGKAEKLLLAGSSLMLVYSLATPLLRGLWAWLVNEQGMSRAATGWVVSLPAGILTIAGLVCLIYAFWLRFKTTGKEKV